MNKKLLACALLGAMSFAQSASAQEFDDRWYLTGSFGLLNADKDRAMDNKTEIYGIGFGKWLNSKISLDIEADRATASKGILDWDLTGLAIVGRYNFVKEGRTWWPYIAAGIGSVNHDQDYCCNSLSRDGSDVALSLGAGLQADLGRWDMRTEVGLRHDQDDSYIYGGPPGNPAVIDEDGFTDVYAKVFAVMALGDEPVAPVTPAAPVAEKTCADLDDDGDGINNCNDKCPGSAAGQAIGPDGCAVPLTIDLKGVNFDFDKDSLRPDAVAILAEAAAILAKYPQMRVEVAGHTDATGPDGYNQNLSERRAKAVYDYLTSNGVDAARLVGPNGFGESKPIDSNDTKEGRARNRRTELNVQN